MPTVSVIIPNYNHAQYLEQRIDSVLNQTYQDYEVIILDDCSPDNSKEIIEKYRYHPKVSHIIFNEENSGTTFKQWQRGIELAKGEWIWIAESDDWCEANFLEEIVGQELSKDVSIAYAQTYIYFENTQVVYANFEGKGFSTIMAGKDFIESKMLPFNGIWNASQALFRRDYYLQVSEQYLAYRFCGDWIFWIEMALMGQVYVNSKFLSYFRKHDKDVTSSASKSGIRYMEELKSLAYFNVILKGLPTKNNSFYIHYCNFLLHKEHITKSDRHYLAQQYARYIPFTKRLMGNIKLFIKKRLARGRS